MSNIASDEVVRVKAYELWEAEGRQHGRDREHWLKSQILVAAEGADLVSLAASYGFGKIETKEWLGSVSGLSYPEVVHRWTVGKQCQFAFTPEENRPAALRLGLSFVGAVMPKAPTVTGDVSVNGMPVGVLHYTLDATPNPVETVFDLPEALGADASLAVAIAVRDPRRPSDLGINDDLRELGFGLVSLTITAAV